MTHGTQLNWSDRNYFWIICKLYGQSVWLNVSKWLDHRLRRLFARNPTEHRKWRSQYYVDRLHAIRDTTPPQSQPILNWHLRLELAGSTKFHFATGHYCDRYLAIESASCDCFAFFECGSVHSSAKWLEWTISFPYSLQLSRCEKWADTHINPTAFGMSSCGAIHCKMRHIDCASSSPNGDREKEEIALSFPKKFLSSASDSFQACLFDGQCEHSNCMQETAKKVIVRKRNSAAATDGRHHVPKLNRKLRAHCAPTSDQPFAGGRLSSFHRWLEIAGVDPFWPIEYSRCINALPPFDGSKSQSCIHTRRAENNWISWPNSANTFALPSIDFRLSNERHTDEVQRLEWNSMKMRRASTHQ